MKGFNRPNHLFSLCGLNCGLCPMLLNKNCPGCGGGEGNQSCNTHRNRRSDMEKAKQFGIDTYNAEQEEKAKILEVFLLGYNDGRKKTLFCVAVNLLEVQDLQMVLREIECKPDMETLTLKEKSAFVAGLLQDAAAKNIDLKLHKKKG